MAITEMQKAPFLAGVGVLMAAAFWFYALFRGGAEWVGPRSFLMPLPPLLIKIAATLWLVGTLCALTVTLWRLWSH